MTNSPPTKPKLNPELRDKLLKESQNPWLGLRRTLWLIFFGSSSLGIFIMGSKLVARENLPLSDLAIQISAVLIFGLLVYYDRNKGGK